MANVFNSPRATLERAKHHVNDFEAAFSAFVNEKPWAYVVDIEPEPGKNIHKIDFNKDLPQILSVIAFDAVNNMRAVLDQIGYAAAVASGKGSPKCTNFPFGDDITSFENNLNGRKVCRDVPPEICDIFCVFQPYRGGNGEILWAMNKLANAKKHCALVPFSFTKAKANFRAHVPDNIVAGRGIEGVPNFDPEKRELILMIVPSDIDPHISGNFTFDISFETIALIRSEPAAELLKRMVGIVERILMASEAECRRLGFIA